MKKWTLEEIEILKDNYGQSSKKELSVLLSGRTWGTIQVKASKLKLSFYGTPEQRLWRQVDKNQNHECWNWTGLCSLKGYGRIGINVRNCDPNNQLIGYLNQSICLELCLYH